MNETGILITDGWAAQQTEIFGTVTNTVNIFDLSSKLTVPFCIPTDDGYAMLHHVACPE